MVEENILMKKRITMVFLIFLVFFLFLVMRLGWIQIVQGGELEHKALENRLRQVEVNAKRGVIYERNMQELAVSTSTDYIYAIPTEVIRSGKEEEIAEKVAEVLEISAENVYEKITKENSWFEYLQRKVDFEKAEQIKEMDLPGISTAEENQRYYPRGNFASHILGFAGIDNQGLEGIEFAYDEILSGKDGAIVMEFDAHGRPMANAVHHYVPPQDGQSLVLTIDETLQHIVERKLDNLMESSTDPRSATIIIMEPDTGKIRALGSRPDFDPNNINDFPEENWRNTAVSNSYEPGSTFKIFTSAAFLEENIIKENEEFYSPGYAKVGSNKIRCWRSHDPHGNQVFSEAVKNSCNPVFVELALRLEKKEEGLLYDYIKAFGFGEKTGINLPGEAEGILIPRKDLKDINIATISMGQGIAVTPIQMAAGLAAVVNGGNLVKPQLVEKIIDKNGNIVKDFKQESSAQVVSKKTSQELLDILEDVVSEGTGRNAYIEGYRVGGKTGTAQKPEAGGYKEGKYVSSFIGTAPINDPALICLVIVDEPKGYPYYGGAVAAPIFKEVMKESLQYLNIPLQKFEESEAEKEKIDDNRLVKVPDLTGLSKEKAVEALKVLNLKIEISGSDNYIAKQSLEPNLNVQKGTKVLLTTGPKEVKSMSTVPDLTGKRIPTAAKLLESVGLNLIPEGSGRAVDQDPPPYEKIPLNESVKVIFKEEEESVIGP